MRMATLSLVCVLLLSGHSDLYADALCGSGGVREPYKFVSGNACTVSYPGQFTWAANIVPAALNLPDADKTRLVELIDLSTLNPSEVTDETRAEFANILIGRRINARIVRSGRIVGRCSLKPNLETSVFREGADASLPVIRIGSRLNCNLPRVARSSLRSGDKIALFQSNTRLISATLKRCSDGCGIVNCR
jgi:hypothetical protein